MRSSLLVRLLIVIGLAAVVGVPGLQDLSPTPAEAQTSVYGLPVGADVWTGRLAAPGDAPVAEDPATAPTEPLIVRFRPRSSRTAQVDAHVQAGARRADALALADTVRVEVPAGQRASALASYAARADVLYAEPDYEVHALYTPNDPQFPSQWGPKKVGIEAAWNVTRGAPAVKVAVVDCGVFSEQTGRLAGDGLAGHPDLRGRVALNQDFTASATGFDDYCNHGTHVAGIIGAAGNNSIGVSGMAPEIALMNAKVLNDSGSGSVSTIANGVIWATDNGARVVNMSLGRDGTCSQTEADAMNYAWAHGVVIVAAAGNSAMGTSGAPGNCNNVISVASTTTTDERSSFSSYGTNVDVAAPGSDIISTVRTGGYQSFNGTSMATPHVAGLAGLIWSLNTGATAQSVVDRIRTTADPIPGTGSLWAWGRINAAAALGGSAPAPISTPTQVPVSAPPPVACPSPRPPVQIAQSPYSASRFDVNLRAGAGVVRSIDFRQLSNASVTVGSQNGLISPFTYQPTSYASDVAFSVTRPNVAQTWTISLVVTDDCGAWTTFVGGGPKSGPHGTVTGTIRDASTGQPISGATVTARENQRTVTTNGVGVYTIPDVPAGTATLDVSAPGYAAQTIPGSIVNNQTTTVDVSLAPTGGSTQDITIALTWGISPADLDTHLSGPTTAGSRFHLYWNNRTPVPYASISQDVHDGTGPETLTIGRDPSTGAWVPGEYRVWAHNYSVSPGFDGSAARVTASRGGQQLGVYNVASATGTSTLPLWRSVNVTVDANGGVALTAVQQMLDGGASTMLRFQDGADGTLEWPAAGKR